MPSCVLLSHSETRDSHVIRDIINHKGYEPRVRRQRNDQRSENEQVQAPWCRLNYRRARMERRKKERKKKETSVSSTYS